MGARFCQKLGRVRKWLHSDELRCAGGDLTYRMFSFIQRGNVDVNARNYSLHER